MGILVTFCREEDIKSSVYDAVFFDDEEKSLIKEVLQRGLNTWQKQHGPEGDLIRKLIEDLQK